MQYLEKKLFEEWELLDIKPKVWVRMVDDIFAVGPEEHFNKWITCCNACNKDITFSLEMEYDNRLPYLDVLLIKKIEGGRVVVETTVYRKPIAANRVLPFQSGHCASHKWGVVKCMTHRALTHCSSETLLEEELTKLRKMFQNAGYPRKGVNRNIIQTKQRFYSGLTWEEGLKEGGEVPNQEINRWGITYHPNIFEEIKRKFKKLNIDVVAANYNALRKKLVHVKDVTPLQEQKGVVYRLNCGSCDASYVGQTGQKITSRLYRHKLAEKNLDFDHYPLVEHCSKKGHQVDWEKVEVLTLQKK